jgi:hypothetical protein
MQLTFAFVAILQVSVDSPRKCSSLPRARTTNFRKLSQRALDEIKREAADWDEFAELRPRTRGECQDGPRPCPWISCAMHLAFDPHEETGNLKCTRPDLDLENHPENMVYMRDTCALDIADRVEESEELLEWSCVAQALNVSIERARQIASSGLQALRVQSIREDVLMNLIRRSK